VQRVDGFLTSRQIAVRASGQHRIWVVDVHGILDGLHLVDRPPFTTRFHKADDQDFEGGIRVLRYDSSTP
jgi:hypothetical protein